MTGAELVTFKKSATALSGVISDLVSFYRRRRELNQAQLAQVKLEADKTLRIARTKAVGELSRINVEEISKTWLVIKSLKLEGVALDHAVEQLDQLSVELVANLRGLGSD